MPASVSKEDSTRLLDALTKFAEALAVIDEIAKHYNAKASSFSEIPFDEPSHFETCEKLIAMIDRMSND